MDYYKVELSEHEINVLLSVLDTVSSTDDYLYDFDLDDLDNITSLLQHKLESYDDETDDDDDME